MVKMKTLSDDFQNSRILNSKSEMSRLKSWSGELQNTERMRSKV